MKPNNNPKPLTVKETLQRSGLETRADALKRSFKTGTTPACCECGTMVEPDGECPHGNKSVLLKAGLV